MYNNDTIYGELIRKKKGWPVFFILLASAFVVLNTLVFNWMESTFAIVIGAVVILLCLVRICRISKINKMRIYCDANGVLASNGKKEFFIKYKKLERVKTAGNKSVKLFCDKNEKVLINPHKKLKRKALKKPLRIKRMKNYKELVDFIEQKIALANQPDVQEVAVSEPDTEIALEAPASLEELIATNKVPVVVALMMNPETNGFTLPACPMVHAPYAEPVPQKILPELPAEPPVTAYEKLLYNKILWLRGDITEDEKNRRNEIIYREEFPELYGGKAKKLVTKSK